jgi:serine protease Do
MSAKEQKDKAEEEKKDVSPEPAEKNTPEEKSDYDFIREKIRERPVNKKKLIKRSLFTSGMAVLFGVIACLTFLLMEPLLSKWVSSDQDIKLMPVELNENVEEEEYPVEAVRPLDDSEVSPATEPTDPDASSAPVQIEVEKPIEEMSLSDDDVENSNGENGATAGTAPAAEPTAAAAPVDREMELEDYRQLYRKMYSMSGEVSKSLVILTADQEIDDWLNEENLRGKRTTGVIIGENGYELLILADSSRIKNPSA